MALDDLLVEELGFGPVWVRRRVSEAGGASSASLTLPSEVAVEARLSRSSRGEVASPDADEAASLASKTSEARLTPLPAANPRDASATRRGDVASPTTGDALPDQAPEGRAQDASPDALAHQPRLREAEAEAEAVTRADREPARAAREPSPPQDHEAPFEAYDDLPWTDDAPFYAPSPAAADAPSDIHTLDWDTLAARVADCERCRLCERRTNTVFGVGDREADWLLIGEAPGENEDKEGEPFVGQAGKLLDNMLRALELSRESNVFITNVLKCRPPGNRNPEPEEVARCEPYLQRQVELVKPKIIVALGRFAAQSLLKTDGSIASMRGRVHEYRGVPVVVTYHPAYLLRSLPDKAKAWADLCLARGTYRDALAALGVEAGAQEGRKGGR
ncbi:uracil-DNA glycosylase family protein [Caballeronia sp. GACF4]|uniref:uracil-DNA glycosylase family protein n=1 Tax=Caballeronia sp. GACF4 TaxID=2921763 RepID=UPI00202949DE|nr:uracil-DNA glycosylase family protein [Caballeronia sp. GACF4]